MTDWDEGINRQRKAIDELMQRQYERRMRELKQAASVLQDVLAQLENKPKA